MEDKTGPSIKEKGMQQERRFDQLERFDDVDRTGEETKFMAFLERVDRLADVQRRRRASYELLGLRAGMAVADVGCGIGTAAIEMARRVAPAGRATGVDLSVSMVAEARRRSASSDAPVEFAVGSALSLPLADRSVDAYRAERVYQHLADIPAALDEAMRVLRPGGRIVLIDQDWDAAFIDAEDVPTGREIHRAFANSLVQGNVGRQFHRQLRRAGFADVHVQAETVTSTDPDEYGFVVDVVAATARSAGIAAVRMDRWLEDQRARLRTGDFFMAMTHFIACATRP